MSSQLLHTLQLVSLPGLGVATYWRLIDYFHDSASIFSANTDAISKVVGTKLADAIDGLRSQAQLEKRLTAEAALRWCTANDVSIIHHGDARYPPQLRQIKHGPPLLYVLGDIQCLHNRQIAVVGSRSCRQGGRENAFTIAAELANNDITITSGLALGIDTCAHRGALSVQGKTVAVLGTGIDKVYPNKNKELAEEIVSMGGAVVSEFPLGTSPSPQNFPQRNRIISGLSLGALVVEAAIKSGSLITARYALEQNREVFAIPGSISNPLSRGCHALLRDGATLVENASDILRELDGFVSLRSERIMEEDPLQQLNAGERSVAEQVDFHVTPIEELATRTGLDIGELLGIMMSLELKGIVCESGAGYTRL